jgi:hypothetical protein
MMAAQPGCSFASFSLPSGCDWLALPAVAEDDEPDECSSGALALPLPAACDWLAAGPADVAASLLLAPPAEAPASAPAFAPLGVQPWRCLDTGHGADCTRCDAAACVAHWRAHAVRHRHARCAVAWTAQGTEDQMRPGAALAGVRLRRQTAPLCAW